jgi:hypothetical protein
MASLHVDFLAFIGLVGLILAAGLLIGTVLARVFGFTSRVIEARYVWYPECDKFRRELIEGGHATPEELGELRWQDGL